MITPKPLCRYSYVIIIDDDEISNFITKRVIEKSDFCKTIHSFTDPEKALAFLREKEKAYDDDTIDFIFLDIKMPVCDGFMFLDKLKELNLEITSEVEVIMLTNLISPEDLDRSTHYKQVVQLVEKPLNEDVLKKILIDDNI
jgi:CheY-like chemotaxis protein